MDRTEASMAPARGGDRTVRRHRCRVSAGRALALVGVAVLATGGLWGPAGAGASSGPHHPGSKKAGPTGPELTLLAPPTIASPTAPFTARLGLSNDGPRAGLSLTVTVYSYIGTPTEFDQTLTGTASGSVLGRDDAIAVSSLPSDPSGGVDLTVPVIAGGVTGPGTGPFTVDLDCQLGSCGRVYPMEIELTDTATGTVTSRLLTYLVYTEPAADTEPLQVALVLPLALGSSSSAGSVPSSSLTSLTDLMGALSGPQDGVALTMAPSPATVVALQNDRTGRSRTALASLVSLLSGPHRQTLCDPFVPVNASALVGAKLGGGTELAEQVRRGADVLQSVIATRAGTCPTGSDWVADGTLDAAALGTLEFLGYADVVVPPGAVSGPTLSITPTRRFSLVGSPRSGNAILSDPGLAALLESTSRSDPAFAADQLLAELEFDYSEAPNAPGTRGVVVAPPATWRADPTVVTDVLDGLENNPMVEPVTLSTLFNDVPVGGTVGPFTEPKSRRPAAVGESGLPARAIAAARTEWTGFSGAVSGTSAGATAAVALGDLLLSAESEELTASEQSDAVKHFDAAFGRQLALLSITSREVRLTARTGDIPITVVKTAPYPVKAVLTVTSDKIAFSAGNVQPDVNCAPPVVANTAGRSSVSSLCTFIHGTNAVYVEMRSRVSGDFRVSVTLTSPEAGLEIASGQLTVRSLSTSAAAIGLSVAAVAVLLGWWGRTMVRTRRARRAAHRPAGDSP